MTFEDRPLDPKREKYIREYANGSPTAPTTHVGELLWEIDRLRKQVADAERTALLTMADEIQGGAVSYDRAVAWLVAAGGPDASFAWAQLMIAAHMRSKAAPPTF